MADEDKKDVDELEDEEQDEQDEEEIGEPGEDDLNANDDESFLDDDTDASDDSDDETQAPMPRVRRRAPVRPGTIGGVARSRLNKAEHAKKAWDELNLQAEANPEDEGPVAYNLRENFEKGVRVTHKKFGLGHVVEIVSPRKIEVLFEDGLRKLVQNR